MADRVENKPGTRTERKAPARGRKKPARARDVLVHAREMELPAEQADPVAAVIPELDELKIRFVTLHRTFLRDAVETIVELGEILQEAEARFAAHDLPIRAFHTWMERELQITRRTGRNYLGLARLAATDPGAIQELKELGHGKLYQLASLPVEARTKLLDKHDRKELADLNAREFAGVLRDYRPNGGRPLHLGQLLSGWRQRVKSWDQRIDELNTQLATSLDEEDRERVDPALLAKLDEAKRLLAEIEGLL